MSRNFRSLAYSLGIHAGLLLALFYFADHLGEKSKSVREKIIVTLENLKHTPPSTATGSTPLSKNGVRAHQRKGGNGVGHPLDLRPNFAKSKDGIPFGYSSNSNSSTQQSHGNPQAKDLLAMDGKTLQAFDQLAMLINGYLDYPQMLAENGVYGLATLDLYFDHDARIDESRSRFLGDNRSVRGLLVSAARQGLVAWYKSIGGRLEREKFRGQHFRADFVIAYTSTQSSDLQKEGEGSYHLVRRSLVQTCLNPAAGGVDVACIAMRVAGAISNRVSENYKIRYQALKDRLEALDETCLRGINEEIPRRS